MRLIDADELIYMTIGEDTDTPFEFVPTEFIKNAEEVDAVPVVRCRECKYLRLTGMVWRCANEIVGMICEPDDYCSRGEKSETFKVR